MVEEKRYYDGIVELREVRSVNEANQLLKQHYDVLKIVELSTTDISSKQTNTTLVYVLGKRTTSNSSAVNSSRDCNVILEQIRKLAWKKAVFDRNGKIYSVGPDDSTPEVKQYLRDQGGKCDDPEFIYKISEKGRINRYPKGDSKN